MFRPLLAVLDLIEVDEESLAFIVMEQVCLSVPHSLTDTLRKCQWSSQLIGDDIPCTLGLFLAAIRQCIEVIFIYLFIFGQAHHPTQHGVFMHKHRIVHLDISIRNLLTDYKGWSFIYLFIYWGGGEERGAGWAEVVDVSNNGLMPIQVIMRTSTTN